ncbi:hypothetical protein [Novosphingobium sp. PY1]|uniref:hypothetical protein n=1 Tax=Novosphingobium sp. PY1 TaxID=1882221 RepID=UPI001A8C40E8|nr:hypothetical protein [Novosphingobium sp. PY1]GFM30699.1 uncharacterized protein PY1_contig-12-60 [Novosphingobium sp. PY1]
MRIADLFRDFGLSGFGLAGVMAAAACVIVAPADALTGWLTAAVLLQSVPFAALLLLAMMRLIPGAWEGQLRTSCDAAVGLWCLSGLTFIPVLLGMGAIYEWMQVRPESAFEAVWISPVFFVARTLLWFCALAWIARKLVGGKASEGTAAFALIMLVLGGSLLAVDWFMSLDPAFHSSGYGLQVMTLEVGAAFPVLLVIRAARNDPPDRPGILGGLLIVFLLLWIYFQFLTYLVIWSGNLPDGAEWYAKRSTGGWRWVALTSGLLGGLPLLALLHPYVRTSFRAILAIAVPVFVGKCLEFAWLALPGRGPMSILAFALALGGMGCLAANYLTPGPRWRRALRNSVS